MGFDSHRENIERWTENRSDDCVKFLADLIECPSASTVGEDEEMVAERVQQEMKKLDYDNIFIDECGNIHGVIDGQNDGAIMLNAHMDTVGVGEQEEWEYDPYGEIDDGTLYGRGASDMKSALASMVYAGGALKSQSIEPYYDLYVSGVIKEESMGWAGTKHAIEQAIDPDLKAVIIGEATEMDVKRGNRGRIGLEVTLDGQSCHASAPERGINPLYHAATIIDRVENLHDETGYNPFLGSGSVTATYLKTITPSNAAVPDEVNIVVDRRLTLGEDETTAHAELEDAIAIAVDEYGDEVNATIETVTVEGDTYTDYSLEVPKYSLPWVLDREHSLTETTFEIANEVLETEVEITKWTFCTDGSYSMGVAEIPTIGFGPMREEYAHTQRDQVELEDVLSAISVYAGLSTEIADEV